MKAYGASLFLSANSKSVLEATQMGYPAGLVLPSKAKDDLEDKGLRIAFDFDGHVVMARFHTVNASMVWGTTSSSFNWFSINNFVNA